MPGSGQWNRFPSLNLQPCCIWRQRGYGWLLSDQSSAWRFWHLAYTQARYHVLRAFPRRSPEQKLTVATPIAPYDAAPASADIAAAWDALERALADPHPDNLSRSWVLKDPDLQPLKQLAPERWRALLQGL